jgi:hypothetical protein
MVGVICCHTHESHGGVPVETERKTIQEFDHEVKWKFQLVSVVSLFSRRMVAALRTRAKSLAKLLRS